MLYTLVVIAGLFNYVFAAPLSSCEAQADCIDVSIEEADDDDNGNAQYEICLIFDGTLDECVKDESDTISHACVAGEDGIVQEEDGEKVEELATNDGSALCDIVPCGTATTFGLKDGASCELDGEFLYANLSIPDYDKWLYCYDGMSCNANGKNSKACKWQVYAPDCEDDEFTSTDTPVDDECPEYATDGASCSVADQVCNYGEVECCGATLATTVCTCDGTSVTCNEISIDCPDVCPGDEPCVCRDMANEPIVTQADCEARCDGNCISFGEGNLDCKEAEPSASSAIYVRSRMDDNDLVTVPETETETGTDTETEGGDTDTPNTEGTSNGTGIINLLPIVSIVLAGLYRM